MTTKTSTTGMTFITLGRELDRQARNAGYINMPDDITNIILAFTGDMRYKPTFLYRIEVKFNFDSYYQRYVNGDYVNTLRNRNRTGYAYFHYCSACCRFYVGHKSHLTRGKHIDNVRNGNDKGVDIRQAVIVKLATKYNANNTYTKNVRMISYSMKDVWKI